MKKGILILLAIVMLASTIEAKESEKLTTNSSFNYYDEVVTFVERGIEFTVFLNGDFDFNTRYTNTYFDYNGQRISRNGVRIDRDRRGRVLRVGNVYINYNYSGNVSRIGSIFVDYRRGYVTRVGDLKVRYNYGNPYFYGQVNYNNNHYYYGNSGINIDVSFGDVCDYNDAYFYKRDFRNNYYRIKEDRNFYYYKSNPNAKIGKRSSIIKRRKPATNKNEVRNSSRYTKRTNTNTSRRNSNYWNTDINSSTRNIRRSGETATTKRLNRNSDKTINSNRRSTTNYNKENKRSSTAPNSEKSNSKRKSSTTTSRKRNESTRRN